MHAGRVQHRHRARSTRRSACSNSTSGFGLFIPVYNMETAPDQAGLLGFDDSADRRRRCSSTSRAAPTATTGSTRSATPHLPGFDVVTHPATCGASRPTRSTTRTGSSCRSQHRRLLPRILRNRGCPPGRASSARRSRIDVPPAPFLQNPTTCGEPLDGHVDVDLLRRLRSRPRRRAVAADHRLRPAQLQPEPLREADDRRRPTPPPGSTSTSRSRSRRARRPRRPRRSATTRSPCRAGFTINPNAADGKVACSDAQASFGTKLRRPLPGVREDRHGSRSTARRCRRRSPARSTSASRCRANRTGSSSPPTASRPT